MKSEQILSYLLRSGDNNYKKSILKQNPTIFTIPRRDGIKIPLVQLKDNGPIRLFVSISDQYIWYSAL